MTLHWTISLNVGKECQLYYSLFSEISRFGWVFTEISLFLRENEKKTFSFWGLRTLDVMHAIILSIDETIIHLETLQNSLLLEEDVNEWFSVFPDNSV